MNIIKTAEDKRLIPTIYGLKIFRNNDCISVTQECYGMEEQIIDIHLSQLNQFIKFLRDIEKEISDHA